MSKVFNMVGGGGGKNISSIIITGLESTDTVTCTKDGKSYIATWDDTDQHWEIVGLPLGTFTVSATNGTKTVTETVLIDIAGVYEVEMYFRLWLYRDGDECEDVTGGWSQCTLKYNNTAFSTAYSSFTKMTDIGAFKFTLNKNNVSGSNGVAVGCANQIDVSNYTELGIKYRYFNLASNSTSGIDGSIWLGTVLGNYYYGQASVSKSPSTGEVLENVTVTKDISNLSGKKYVWIQHENGAGGNVTVHSEMQVSEVWLK